MSARHPLTRPGFSSRCVSSYPGFSRSRLAASVLQALALLSSAAMADTGTACDATPNACEIVVQGSAGGSGDTGGTPTVNPIIHAFTDAQTLTAGSTSAIQFVSVGGNGGGHNGDGGNGGSGGAAGDVGDAGRIQVGSGVTAQGTNANGILFFLSVGGGGGNGGGAYVGSVGTGGTGGTGGTVGVDLNGNVTAGDANSPGLQAVSQGGFGGSGEDGGPGFYGAHAGAGGIGGAVTLNVGSTVTANNLAALALSQGGAGGEGPQDKGGNASSIGRDGGNGGQAGLVQASVVAGGIVGSQASDGVQAVSQGGQGGNGGNSGPVNGASQSGNGGAGGPGGEAGLTVFGSAQGGGVGALAASAGGAGGVGGTASGSNNQGDVGNGGDGGAGGSATKAKVLVAANASSAGVQVGAAAFANGGAAGAAGQGIGYVGIGGAGHLGGSGGTATGEVAGEARGVPGFASVGLLVQANGGAGGAGAAGGGTTTTGGSGGNGGIGGTASATIDATGRAESLGQDSPTIAAQAIGVSPAVLVMANGGGGGVGGDAAISLGANGGGAGYGGAGGTASAVVNGLANTTGSLAPGVVVQATGGSGSASGDAAAVFFSHGGKAQNGGAGGVAIYGGSGMVTTSGINSAGVIAQSIGGGGGTGGNATSLGAGVTAAIGGNGGAGGNGQAVKVGLISGDASTTAMSGSIITRGDESTGALAQSVGGGGGNGGNATAAGLSMVSLGIGGDGKGGGTGGPVTLVNDGLVTTFGLQSGGLAAQSVGGGGGNGGAGVSIAAGGQVAMAFAVGGTGAGGGSGGTVTLTNNQQVTTYGADAYGMKAQSISGGGGEGGTASATAISYSSDPEVPSVSLTMSLGGSGGAGGNQSQSPVVLTNNGFVSTAGDGAIGLIGQSIAGGGGNGGDSTATSYSGGDSNNISVALGGGGTGGAGGTAGPVTVNNNNLVVTFGESAYGVEAQSVGGGGGTGGAGDASASASKAEYGATVTLAVGGAGGTGGVGGAVVVNNSGSVATRGDAARAVFAQSVGGGGGASGGGAAKANGQDLTVGVTVGGNGGSGGDGGTVNVTNTAGLLTNGSEADGIYAQSVGGGGGNAGKGASTAGGTQDPKEVAGDLANKIASGLGLGQQGQPIADGVYKYGSDAIKAINQISQLQTLLTPGGASLQDDDPDDGTADNLKLTATIGGQGGAGGVGKQVTVGNSGTIATTGLKSDGIFAQSVGGGGGVGGATSFSGSSGQKGQDSASLNLGASGAGGGGAGEVDVTNDISGSITTSGVTANGITAQSVGGGGGKGGVMASKAGALKNLNVTVGGSGGAGGDGGAVNVYQYGAIATGGRNAWGILAQSVGGGGGSAHVLSSDPTTSSVSDDDDDDIKINVTIGGDGGTGGNGGAVTVTALGQSPDVATNITTTGVGGIGIVAQSIGGGGGTLIATSGVADSAGGGSGISDDTVIPVTIGGSNGSTGNGGAISVSLGNPKGSGADERTSSVDTTGANAYGVLAQSVGGGGGLVNGASPASDLTKLFGSTNQKGNGGSVSVSLTDQLWIRTKGDGSVGILAQSVGGGGGVIGTMSNVNVTSAMQAPPTAEGGQGGDVGVTVGGNSYIVTYGANAHGIFAQSVGGGGGVVAGTGGTGYTFSAASPYTGCGGTSGVSCTGGVTVSLNDSSFAQANGDGAYAIVVQSRGNGVNDTTINIAPNADAEAAGTAAAALYIDGAGTNTINNQGTIDNANADGVAIAGSRPATINNTGQGVVTGKVTLPTGVSTFNNGVGATFHAGATVDLGTGGSLNNAGTLEIGRQGVAAMQLRGDLVQSAGGRMVVDVDGQRSDTVQVSGNTRLAGTLEIRPTSLAPVALNVLQTASTPDTSALQVTDAGGGQVVGYRTTSSSSGLTVTPYAKLVTAARSQSLSSARVETARHLENGFVPGLSAGQGRLYAQLATLPSSGSYRQALDNLSGEALQSVAVAAHATSLGFAERMNSCPALESGGDMLAERDCAWVRAIDNRSDRATSNDAAGFEGSTHTAQLGGQKRIGDGWLAGASLAYDDSRFTPDADRGQITGHGVSGGLVLKRELGNWLFSAGADYGTGKYTSERQISIGSIQAQARGKFRLHHFGLHGRAAYRLAQNGWYAKPYVDLHAVRLSSSAFDENGADELNLRVQGNRDTFYNASPMLELGGLRELGNGKVLHGYVALGGSFDGSNRWGATSSLQGVRATGADGFAAAAQLPRQRLKATAGAQLSWSGAALRLEYSGEYASRYKSHTASVKVEVKF